MLGPTFVCRSVVFGLPPNTRFLGTNRLTLREKRMLYVSLHVERPHSKFKANCVMAAPLNDNGGRLYWREDFVNTIDRNSRIWIIIKSTAEAWIMRPLSVPEIYRLMSRPLQESITNTCYQTLVRRLVMNVMVELAGASFDEATIMCHFFCSVMSMQTRIR